MGAIEFRAWPKIARLFRDITITEKIDGTNAAVGFTKVDQHDEDAPVVCYLLDGPDLIAVTAQSRNRLITQATDNHGFAAWVAANVHELYATLGLGLHYGEWWGWGIQRGYGLDKGEKRFSLFNTTRWADADLSAVPGLGVVPVLYTGPFSTGRIRSALDTLLLGGSIASPGFLRPEGVITYHHAANTMFKATIENDEAPKSAAAG